MVAMLGALLSRFDIRQISQKVLPDGTILQASPAAHAGYSFKAFGEVFKFVHESLAISRRLVGPRIVARGVQSEQTE